jgi:hypothetical protein
MTQPTKREQLAAMGLEDFKAHLRTIVGDLRNKSPAHCAPGAGKLLKLPVSSLCFRKGSGNRLCTKPRLLSLRRGSDF